MQFLPRRHFEYGNYSYRTRVSGCEIENKLFQAAVNHMSNQPASQSHEGSTSVASVCHDAALLLAGN